MRMRWVEHVAHIEKEKCIEGFWRGNVNETEHVEDLDIDGRKL